MVMDVAFTPQREFYYHRSLSPSIHSFLAETPMGFGQTHWHRAREKGSPYMGAVRHPTPHLALVPLANLQQWDGSGSWAGEDMFYNNIKHLS